GGSIAIRSLKKRKDASGSTRVFFRNVPVPAEFLDTLNTAHGIREAQRSRKKAAQVIWELGRVRVWQIVKKVMIEAGLPDAPHRSPKGLRHGFGMHADAVGKEEQDIAARMWRRGKGQSRPEGPGLAPRHRAKRGDAGLGPETGSRVPLDTP
ncbi:MAG: hypothetical protein AB7E21_07575, partial [Pseudodonghicola sp.]